MRKMRSKAKLVSSTAAASNSFGASSTGFESGDEADDGITEGGTTTPDWSTQRRFESEDADVVVVFPVFLPTTVLRRQTMSN